MSSWGNPHDCCGEGKNYQYLTGKLKPVRNAAFQMGKYPRNPENHLQKQRGLFLELDDAWDKVKLRLKATIASHKYLMWIDPVKIVSHTEDSISLFAPNPLFIQRLKEHYLPGIQKEFSQLGKKVSIEFITEPQKASSDGLSLPKLPNPELPENAQESKNLFSALTKDPAENVKPKQTFKQPMLPGFEQSLSKNRLFKKDYTFDNFVVGENSDFAYKASLSLAKGQLGGTKIIYLMGKTGLGKSHLSQAAGQHIMAQHPQSRVYYVTAEDFTNEMIHCLQHKTIDKFKTKYRRQCDTLILEDVHFLAGKAGTQKELAMTLDYLLDADKKIIFSGSDCPDNIPKMDPQLTSRLAMGLLTELKCPDFSTRVRILEKKAGILGCKIPKTVLEFLAQELNRDVRQLESGLLGVSAKSSLLDCPIDMHLADSIVRKMVQQQKHITLDSIKDLVCKEFSITEKQLLSKSRKQSIVKPRQIAMFLARKYTDLPLKQIGSGFNRYHATALYAMNSIEKLMSQKGQVHEQVSYLSQKLEGNFRQ